MNLKPWNGGFIGGPIPVAPTTPTDASFMQLGQEITITHDWPQNRSQWNTALDGPGHVCFAADLSGFAVDNPNNGNHVQQNLSYVSASTINSSFLVAAPREVPRTIIGRDGRIEYVLRGHWDNLPPKSLGGSPPFAFKITNASRLRLKEIGKGYYSMRLRPGERKQVMLGITGGVMPYPVEQHRLPANAGGDLLQPPSGRPPLDIAAKPGTMLSILTRGVINLGQRPPSNANGFVDREQFRRDFLLQRGPYRPEEHIGAVIGSCDKFKTSFVVGTDYTFVVPERCERLFLAVNNVAGRYDESRGELELNVMAGEPISLPTRVGARGAVAMPQFGIPAQLQPGSLMPQLVFDVSQRYRPPRLRTFVLNPTGYVAYAVYMTHPDGR